MVATRFSVKCPESSKNFHDAISKLKIIEESFPPLESSCSLGETEVLIQVEACHVNYPDLMKILRTPQGAYPFVAGFELAGVVLAVGGMVRGFKRGDAVMGTCREGALTTHALVNETSLIHIPQGITFEQASCWYMGYMTAYHCLIERAQLVPNEEFVLINGSTSGVGYAAVQMSKLLGCKVIATGQDDEKLSILRHHAGADFTINTNQVVNFTDLISEYTNGKGVNVVFDTIGGTILEQSLRSCAFAARILIVGFTSGKRPKVESELILSKCLSVIGCRAFEYVSRSKDGANRIFGPRVRTLFHWANQGFLRPYMSHSYPLTNEGVRDSYQCLLLKKVIGGVSVRTGSLAKNVPYPVVESEEVKDACV